MAEVKVQNIGTRLIGFKELRLTSNAERKNSVSSLDVDTLNVGDIVQLEFNPGASTTVADLIVLSDYFTPEDIHESDTLRSAFEDNQEVDVILDGTPITTWKELIAGISVGGAVTVTGGTIDTITNPVTVTAGAQDDIPLNSPTLTTSFSTTIVKSGASTMSVVSYADKPIEIAYVTAATPDTVNVLTLSATDYVGTDPQEISQVDGLNVGGKDGIQIRTTSAPTAGKDFALVIKTT